MSSERQKRYAVILSACVRAELPPWTSTNQSWRGIADIDGLDIDVNAVATNILYFDVRQPGLTVSTLLERLKTAGVLMLGTGPNSIRAVTHLDVSKEGIERAVEVLRQVVH